MNRKVISIMAIILVAAVVLTVFFLTRNHSLPEASDISATTTTTKLKVKVPNVIEDSEPDSTATTETELLQIDDSVQTNTLQSRYTLPATEEPADIPPDEPGTAE